MSRHTDDAAEARRLLGNVCARCGGTAGPFAVDHINGGRQAFKRTPGHPNRGKRATRESYRDIIRGDTANYQLLCRHGAANDCHRDKGREDRAGGYLSR
jgi:hypothetical protein